MRYEFAPKTGSKDFDGFMEDFIDRLNRHSSRPTFQTIDVVGPANFQQITTQRFQTSAVGDNYTSGGGSVHAWKWKINEGLNIVVPEYSYIEAIEEIVIDGDVTLDTDTSRLYITEL